MPQVKWLDQPEESDVPVPISVCTGKQQTANFNTEFQIATFDSESEMRANRAT